MRLIPLLCAFCFIAGCANDPSASAPRDDGGVYVTGSNIKRHDYQSGSDHVVSGVRPDATTGSTGGQVR